MFTLTKDTKIPPVDKTVLILQRHAEDIGVPLDYDRMQEYIAYYTIAADNLIYNIIQATIPDGPRPKVTEYKDSYFISFLDKVGCTRYLDKTPKGAVSLADDSIKAAIAKEVIPKEIADIMTLYSKVKSYKQLISPFANILQEYGIVNWETYDNHRMLLVKPIAVPQITGRVGYQSPAITNFGRDVQDIITVPKGWVKCEADSGQIDPRISQSWYIHDPQLIKCTNMYNDAYYGYLHYCCWLTDEERASGTLDLKPREVTDEMKAQRKEFKTFGNAVMYGSTENRLGNPNKANFIRYIGGHPERVKRQHLVENQVMRGDYIFYTYFGTPVDIMSGPSAHEDLKHSAEEQFRRRVNRGINAPIQGTAADLFRYSVMKADNLLTREAPNSRIIAYVHDSGKFMIAEDEYDKVIDQLKEIVSYQVEDWIPIYGDYEEGVHIKNLKRFLV